MIRRGVSILCAMALGLGLVAAGSGSAARADSSLRIGNISASFS